MSGQRYTPEFKDEAVKLITERGYSKKGRKVLCKPARVKYQFILEYSHQFKIKTMCRVLKIARAGYYAWLHEPESSRTIEDKRLLQLIRSSYDASYGIYGYRRITLDLKELGDGCGPNRVLKIMKNNGITAVRGIRNIKAMVKAVLRLCHPTI